MQQRGLSKCFRNELRYVTFILFMFNCLAPNIKGKDGAVSLTNIQSSTLDKQSKQRFPLELLKIMKRRAEDLLLAEPKSRSGKKALKFIIGVVEEKADVDVSFKRGTSVSFQAIYWDYILYMHPNFKQDVLQQEQQSSSSLSSSPSSINSSSSSAITITTIIITIQYN